MGRCRPDEVEKCEVLEAERVCRWRPLTGVKVTSARERGEAPYSEIPKPARSFSSAGRERSRPEGWVSLADSLRK